MLVNRVWRFSQTAARNTMYAKKTRAIIYTDKARDSWMVESLSTPDMAVIHTKIEDQETLVVSSYLDINNDEVITNELEEMVAFATRKGWAVIIGMDSNCHCFIRLRNK